MPAVFLPLVRQAASFPQIVDLANKYDGINGVLLAALHQDLFLEFLSWIRSPFVKERPGPDEPLAVASGRGAGGWLCGRLRGRLGCLQAARLAQRKGADQPLRDHSLKGGKQEFDYLGSMDVPCSVSLFLRPGNPPAGNYGAIPIRERHSEFPA